MKCSLEERMFSIRHTDSSGERNPPLECLSSLYDELASADQEHGDVAVIHDESGWTISAHRDGRLVMEERDPGADAPPYAKPSSPRGRSEGQLT